MYKVMNLRHGWCLLNSRRSSTEEQHLHVNNRDEFNTLQRLHSYHCQVHMFSSNSHTDASLCTETRLRQLVLKDHGYAADALRPFTPSVHCVCLTAPYPRRDGKAEFTWVTGYRQRWFAWLKQSPIPVLTGANVEQLC